MKEMVKGRRICFAEEAAAHLTGSVTLAEERAKGLTLNKTGTRKGTRPQHVVANLNQFVHLMVSTMLRII